MLQVSVIKNQTAQVIEGLTKKGFAQAETAVQQALDLDQTRRQTQTRLDAQLAEAKQLAKDIGRLMKAGQKEEAEAIKARTAALKASSKSLEEQLNQANEALTELLYTLPNVPHATVPAGSKAEDNVTVDQHGELPALGEGAQAHWDLIKAYDIIDFELGTKITGAGFPVYKGQGARLQRALINFFLDQAQAAGYTEVQPPILVNEASGFGTGQLPDKEGQMYTIGADGLYVIPTAEVPITNIFRDEIIEANKLPVKCAGYTPCFRREAGSWGAHVRGLNRLHQFDKVEIVQVVHPDQSYEVLDQMRAHIEGLLQALELPYRVLNLCGGDLGFTAALTYDMEVYSGAQQRWLEVSSVSNFEAYQANRLKLRFRQGKDKPQLCHTLNGSALALPRIVAALLENNQGPEGIAIPKVLQPYTGFSMITKP